MPRKTPPAPPLAVTVRPIDPGDTPALVAVLEDAYPDPAARKSLSGAVRRPGVITLVARYGRTVVGVVVFDDTRRDRRTLLALAVHAAYRRRGVGKRLAERLSDGPRTRVTALVPERDLGAQLFLRACGFYATRVVPGCGDRDGLYHFESAREKEVLV